MTKNRNRNKNRINNAKNTVNNGLASALDLPCGNGYIQNPLTNPATLYYNSSPVLLTLNWQPLTYAYKSNGFIQTAINQIVDDAFRNQGMIIDSETLDSEELEQLRQAVYDYDIEEIKDAIRWGELYGGGVLIANTDQDFTLPLDEKQLKNRRLKFMASDRWQCIANGISPYLAKTFTLTDNMRESTQSGITIDASRIGIFTGVKAPYLLRSMLQGWGLSIFEAIIPPLTQYLKAMGVTLELLDEAKIDILKIFDLANVLLSPDGEAQIRKRVQIAADNKNYKSVLAMDTQDDYQQKQINFSGLPEMIVQIQYLVCAALKRPYSKIFGKGSSGFSSGEDDLENYNTIVDSEIRTPATSLIKWAVGLRCLQLFGRIPPDIKISWKPLRVMTEKDEAEIKSKKLENYLKLFDRQILTKAQLASKLTKDGIAAFSRKEIDALSEVVSIPAASAGNSKHRTFPFFLKGSKILNDWEFERKHPRDKEGKFAKTGSTSRTGTRESDVERQRGQKTGKESDLKTPGMVHELRAVKRDLRSILRSTPAKYLSSQVKQIARRLKRIGRVQNPETIAGAKQGKPMSFEQADGGRANPKFSRTNPAYYSNCQSSVVAHEARMRGYDVQAAPNYEKGKPAELAYDPFSAWLSPITGKKCKGKKMMVTSHVGAYNYLNYAVKQGQRYHLKHSYFSIEDGVGVIVSHITTVDRDEHGRLRIYDPQVNKIFVDEDLRWYIKEKIRLDIPDLLPQILRVDDKNFNPYYMNDVLKKY